MSAILQVAFRLIVPLEKGYILDSLLEDLIRLCQF